MASVYAMASRVDPVTEYVRMRLRQLDREGVGMNKVVELAGGLVSKTGPSQVKNGAFGVGRKTLPGYAKAFGMKASELTAAAEDWWEQEGKAELETREPERWHELDDRYPNRAKAIMHARQLGYSEEAVRIVVARTLKSDEDPPPRKWLERIQEVDRQLSDPFFAGIAARAPDEDV